MSQTDSTTPDQIDETVQRLVEVHETRARETGVIQKIANRVTRALGQPVAVVSIVVLIVLWIFGNAVASALGTNALDHFPYPDLAFFATVCAFLVTLLILTTQRHEQDVSRRRDQLTLHMAVLTEKKIAKVIALLEEQRRDNPLLHPRDDAEAAKLAQPADPGTSLDRIEASSLE
jgi:uncharacterized membrane protein